jgi:N-acetylneuraminate epimerase
MCVPALAATLLLAPLLSWERLPNVPDAEGFAGSFAGVSGQAMILAGGANFPAGRPWEGGAKVWHDCVYVLGPGAAAWNLAGRLPVPVAYGASVTHGDRIVCVGGSDADSHRATVFTIRWDGHSIQTDALPPLPRPLALHCGAAVGDRIFVAGGTASPDADVASRSFLSLDLSDLRSGWQELEPWPGPGRILAAAGTAERTFYLFGGAGLIRVDGKRERVWLRDAYSYGTETGWSRLPDLPRAVVAAPSPAPLLGGGVLALLGGDDGSLLGRAPVNHPGFRRDVLGFDLKAGQWRRLDELPFALVTTPSIRVGDKIVVPGGECQPGIRSTAVWQGTVKTRDGGKSMFEQRKSATDESR